MALPAAYLAALGAPVSTRLWWVEIEGLDYGIGNFTADASWFSARVAAQQYLGIKGLADVESGPPAMAASELDPLGGVAEEAQELEIRVADDGTLAVLLAAHRTIAARLSEALTLTAGSLRYTGSVAGFAVPGLIHIGHETLSVTAHNAATRTFTVTRAQRRTRALAHPADAPIIAASPLVASRRRAWLYEVMHQPGESPLDSNKVERFSGTLVEAYEPSTGVVALKFEGVDADMRRPVFRSLRKLSSRTGEPISGSGGIEPGLRPQSMGGPGPFFFENYHDEIFTPGTYAIRVDDEVIAFSYTDATKFSIVARGLFNTQVVPHDANWEGVEVVALCKSDAGSASYEQRSSRFSSVPTASSPLSADHPLLVLLQVLLSTGNGTNFSGRNYDVLPAEWGLGIDVSRVDVAEIERLALQLPDLRLGALLQEEVEFFQLADWLLRPLGLFGVTKLEGLWTIRRHRPPLPDEGQGSSSATRISGAGVRWAAGLPRVVRRIVNRCARDLEGDSVREFVVALATGDHFSGGRGEELEIDAPLYFPAGEPIIGAAPTASGDLEAALLRRAGAVEARYARPPPRLRQRVSWDLLHREVGDPVLVTGTTIPNTVTGSRGLTGVSAQIVTKTPDERSKTIELDLEITGYAGGYRYVAPALKITSVAAGVGTFSANQYTDPVGGQTDSKRLKADGTTLEEVFIVDDPVAVLGSDLRFIGFGTISAINHTARTISISGGVVLVAGYVITHSHAGSIAWERPLTIATFAFADRAQRFYP